MDTIIRKKRHFRIFAFLLVVILSFFTVPIETKAANDYPYYNANENGVDPWNFYYRQCTSFVAWRLNHNNGVAFTNQYKGASRWGNATTWGTVAKNLGISVDNNPAVGSVAWWSSGMGHVAWVSAVNGDNVTIEEYNWSVSLGYGTRVINKSSVTGYIHIKDLGPTSVNISNGTYFIKSAADSNKALNVYTSYTPASRNEVTLYPFNKNDLAQKWKLEKVGDAYVIRTVNNNVVLNVYNTNAANNNDNVNVLTYDSNDNCQLWIIESAGNNKYIIRSKMNTNVVLAPIGVYKDQTDVRVQTYNGSDSQKWVFEVSN